MEKLVITVCSALAIVCVSGSPAIQSSMITEGTDFETCTKQILEHWLTISVPHVHERMSFRDQNNWCSWWSNEHYKNHLSKFADCYEFGFDEIHRRISGASMSETQRKLYERRFKAVEFCIKVAELSWKKVSKEPARLVNDKISAKICAQKYLMDGESFKLAADFQDWPREEKANYCEEARERSAATEIKDCEKFRAFDYLKAYSDAEKKSYYEIKDGFQYCERFFGWKFDWSKEEEPMI